MTEAAGQAAERSRIYWWLASCFLTAPDDDVLAGLRSAVNARPAADGDPLARFAAALHDGGEDLSGRLAVEHARLFGGLQEAYGPPPPFESVWRRDGPVGTVTVGVVDSYARAGFAEIDLAAGAQDHLGVELKFVALLCHREAEAWGAGNERQATDALLAQRDFLDTHLLRWAPAVCETVMRDAREPFYTAVANLTRDTLDEDRAQIELALESLQAA